MKVEIELSSLKRGAISTWDRQVPISSIVLEISEGMNAHLRDLIRQHGEVIIKAITLMPSDTPESVLLHN